MLIVNILLHNIHYLSFLICHGLQYIDIYTQAVV